MRLIAYLHGLITPSFLCFHSLHSFLRPSCSMQIENRLMLCKFKDLRMLASFLSFSQSLICCSWALASSSTLSNTNDKVYPTCELVLRELLLFLLLYQTDRLIIADLRKRRNYSLANLASTVSHLCHLVRGILTLCLRSSFQIPMLHTTRCIRL